MSRSSTLAPISTKVMISPRLLHTSSLSRDTSHRSLAVGCQPFEHLVSVTTQVVAHRYHGAVHGSDTYAGTEGLEVEEEEHAALQLHKTVIGHCSGKLEGPITVHVTPGVNFVVGKVLHYDDMPTISATVTMTESGPKLSDFKVDQ